MKTSIATALAMTAGIAFAAPGHLSTLAFDPERPKAGQQVKITVGVDGEAPTNCGLAVSFDDGSDEQIKIDGNKAKFPLTINKTYANPGSYNVKAEGRKITSHFPCVGDVQMRLTVDPSDTAKAAKAAPVAAAAPNCPDGYKPKGKMGKSGDFTCMAGKGAARPDKVIDCGDKLEYFQTKSTLGCRKEGK